MRRRSSSPASRCAGATRAARQASPRCLPESLVVDRETRCRSDRLEVAPVRATDDQRDGGTLPAHRCHPGGVGQRTIRSRRIHPSPVIERIEHVDTRVIRTSARRSRRSRVCDPVRRRDRQRGAADAARRLSAAMLAHSAATAMRASPAARQASATGKVRHRCRCARRPSAVSAMMSSEGAVQRQPIRFRARYRADHVIAASPMTTARTARTTCADVTSFGMATMSKGFGEHTPRHLASRNGSTQQREHGGRPAVADQTATTAMMRAVDRAAVASSRRCHSAGTARVATAGATATTSALPPSAHQANIGATHATAMTASSTDRVVFRASALAARVRPPRATGRLRRRSSTGWDHRRRAGLHPER